MKDILAMYCKWVTCLGPEFLSSLLRRRLRPASVSVRFSLADCVFLLSHGGFTTRGRFINTALAAAACLAKISNLCGLYIASISTPY